MTKKIQEAFCKWLVRLGDEAVCENYSGNGWEKDIASVSKSGLLREYEIKVTRSDFLADKKRKSLKFAHYQMKQEGTAPNYFYYVCPKGLIKESEIPSYAGLYYYYPNERIICVKNATKIHKHKVNKEKTFQKMLRLTIQRKYLGGSMMTFLNRESKARYGKMMAEQEAERKKNEALMKEAFLKMEESKA